MRNERVIRFRITDDVLRRFRVICAYYSITPPKQIDMMVLEFVKIHEENIKKIEEAKKNNPL